jgi:cytochrome c peroxidase
MGFTHSEMTSRIEGLKSYARYFEAAFGDSRIDIDRVAKAIASFERTILTGNAPYDRWLAGDKSAMSASAIRGFNLFNDPKKANCAICHDGFNFSDSDFHNLGVGMKAKNPDLGRYDVTKMDKDKGAFKTPTLRNLSDTAPYMHDGSQKDLKVVVEFYNQGGEKNPWLDGRIRALHLTPSEIEDVVAFLDALNGDKVLLSPPQLPK